MSANLPKEANEDIIHSLCLSFGNILNVKKGNNYIDIQFQEIEDSTAAVENLKGFKLYDMYLQVSKIGEFNPLDSLEEKRPIWEQSAG
jgi:RNA recognition motif-containing protein